jgi:hypothetical protein
VGGQHHAPAAVPLGKSPGNPFCRRLGKYHDTKITKCVLINQNKTIYLFIIFYIPWIIWGKPHLDTGIVNLSRNTLYNMCTHTVYAIASIRHGTRVEQFNTSHSVAPK